MDSKMCSGKKGQGHEETDDWMENANDPPDRGASHMFQPVTN